MSEGGKAKLRSPNLVAKATDTSTDDQSDVLALHAEQVVVSKRVRRTLVRAKRSVCYRDKLVEEDLTREQVIIRRVPIGHFVDSMPPVRQEGDVTIFPVVEEEIVVQRRLVLREEVHVHHTRRTERHVETVTLREQQIAVTRLELDDED